MDQVWVNRAVSAEAAVTGRHLKRLWALPGTQLGVVAWPPARRDRWFGGWHYWWQAHLLDCLVDAQLRDPQPQRRIKIARQIRSHRLRNNGSWVNSYYDDMAWLALALERAARIAGVERKRALHKLNDQFVKAWVPEDGGGIPWRKQDQFFNAPANGPAGIFLARYGDRLRRAQQMADWIDETLIDPDTHLVFDGIKAGSLVRAQYTYCQGVVLGLETELAARTQDERHAPRVHRRRRSSCRGAEGRRRRRAVLRNYRSLSGFGRHDVAGRFRCGCGGPRNRPRNRAGLGAVGVEQPAVGARAAAIRTVLGSHRRFADVRWPAGRIRRGCGHRVGDSRARSVGATIRLDADGGRVRRDQQ